MWIDFFSVNRLRGLFLIGLFLGVCASAGATPSAETLRQANLGASQLDVSPRLIYELRFEFGGKDAFPLQQRPRWMLTVSGTGFDPAAGAICLVFDNWGDWAVIDSLYIDTGETNPAVDADLFPGNAIVLQAPASWNGSFDAEFSLQPLRAGTKSNQRWSMLPQWSPSYSFGQTRNVFPQVFQDEGKVIAHCNVTLSAPPGVKISSGWLGLTDSIHTLSIDPTLGNGFLGFGEPLEHQRRKLPEGRLEVIHYGKGQMVAHKVADLVEKLSMSISGALGPPADPLVVYITDVGGGGMGTDYGLVLGYEVETPAWQIDSPYYRHFIAHEFFHHWLGSKVSGSESFTWFHEGFTEYFSLWHLAAIGAISQDWFYERLMELGQEAIDKSSWGTVAFADQEVPWRDGDGPNEIMAYKGGAVLAFLLDVQLRESGYPGGQQMLRDFLDDGKREISLIDLQTWSRAHELDAFWNEYVVGLTVPDLDAWMNRAKALDDFFTFQAEPSAD